MFIAGIRPDLATPFFMGRVSQIDEQRRRPLFNFLDRNQYAREAATRLALLRFEQDEEAQLSIQADGDTGEEGRLIRFLNWCVEHKEEIKALIQLIVSLFAGVPVPAATGIPLNAMSMAQCAGPGCCEPQSSDEALRQAADTTTVSDAPSRLLLAELNRRLGFRF